MQLYLGRPDKFNKIKPIWDLIPNDGPRLKVIYRWEEIVKVASLKKEQNIVDENFLKGKDLYQEGASTPKIKEESIELEARYIRDTDNCVNVKVPGRTKKEYYEDIYKKIEL